MNLNAKSIENATKDLTSATNAYHEAVSREAHARFELERAEMSAILSGLSGKNEHERKAQLFTLTLAQRQALNAVEETTRQVRRDLDEAKARLDCLRYQLRLLEISKAA